MSKPKVILLVPTYNSSDYFDYWARNIYAMRPKPDLVIFAENNSTDDTLKNIINFKLPHEIIRVWFRDDIYKQIQSEDNEYLNICHIRQLLLTRARQLNPDYVIFVDDDVIPPTNLISEIIKAEKDLVGGYYYRNFPEGMWICSRFYNPTNGKPMYVDEYWLKYLCQKESPKYVKGKLIIAIETSGGCLALSRKIINDKRLTFYPRAFEEKYSAEDFGYCVKAEKLGYKVYVHRFLRCFHILDRKTFRPWTEKPDGSRNCVEYKWGETTI